MEVNRFSISTNHPFNKYKPGQTVRGKVHFNLDNPKTVRAVSVELKGVAQVTFSESSNNESIKYHAEQEYFNERILLSGDGDSFELLQGDYDYKFQYNLPNDLPSSYEGDWGSIKYTIKVILDIPLGFDDGGEIKLHIQSPINLNLIPYLEKPDHRIAQKHLSCLSCQSGTLQLEIILSKSGYAYGEDIPFKVDVENSTTTKVRRLECELKQMVTFHSEQPYHKIRRQDTILSSQCLRGVAERCTEVYEEVLKVPYTAELNFSNCRIFEVSYNFKITAKIHGFPSDLSITIPVTLGNVRITQNNVSEECRLNLTGLGTPYPYEGKE